MQLANCIATNNVTFDVGSKFVFLGNAADTLVKLQNFINRVPAANYSYRDNDALSVYGAFKPLTPYWHGLVMMDGSTLDLSNLNAALATCSTGGTAAHGHSLLKFAENATIRVNVGNRTLHKGDYLVTWTAESKPTNLNTVKFKCTGGRSFRVEVDEDGEGTDGLRFIPSGFLMIVK